MEELRDGEPCGFPAGTLLGLKENVGSEWPSADLELQGC